MQKLSTKIWLLVVAFLAFTVCFMYGMTHYLYERLYVEDAEQSMIEVGKKLASTYDGGKVHDDFVEQVDRYNMYSNMNVFAVRNPRELSACVPFDIDYDTLIGSQERKTLLKGETVTKQGYEKRFDRQVISVVVPLVDQQRLEGIIYLYYPLENITELAAKDIVIIAVLALLFLALMTFLTIKGIHIMMKPLKRLQEASTKMATGDYATRVEVTSRDEIGALSTTFNEMAASIQRSDEEQKQFLANVSHELRTPISYVKGYSEALAKGLIPKEQCTEKLALISKEATRMEKLTTELLQLSRAEQMAQLNKQPLVLAEALREALAIAEQRAIEKQMTFDVSLDETLIVEADDEKLKQIVVNLIENAIRYSEPAHTIIVTAQAHGEFAQIIVKDEGIGIPAADLPHIAERFYRVNKARSRSDGGTGLGLSIVAQLVKAHGGQWLIDSEVGKGTAVTLQLPLLEMT
jgi:signal transduction histidine kinase